MAKTREKKIPMKFIGANVPLDIYEAVRSKAQENGRSLSKQILFILKESVAAGTPQ